MYNDNLRVFSAGESFGDARRTVEMDAVETGIKTGLYSSDGSTGGNINRQSSLVGYLDNVSIGTHQLRVKVQTNSGDAYTGWQSSFLLQFDELPPEGS